MTLLLGGSRRRILPASKKGFNPQQYFQNGEAGAWYDPSDLTAEKVAWRRNLLTWSEDFTNAAWTKDRSSITPNAGTSWDGTATASKLVEDTTASASHLIRPAAVSVGGTVGDTTKYCFSIYAKAAGRTAINVFDNAQGGAGSGDTSFNLATGTIISGTGQIIAAGGGWYRCIIFPSRTSGIGSSPQVRLLGPGNVVSYTGDGTSGVLIDSAQLETSPTATAYQRITDFTSDFLAAFPTHALYQNSAGTTPVTALGQPVGLAIDKSRGGLANVGAELVTNGDFATNLNGWTLSGTTLPIWSASGIVLTSDGSFFSRARQTFATTAGRSYRLTLTVNVPSGSLLVDIGTTAGGSDIMTTGALLSVAPSRSFVFVAQGTTTHIELENGSTGSPVLDNISVREVPGVHAIQPTNSSRPLLDGRVNLLTFSEQFDNAGWTKLDTTITANSIAAPDGTTTADLATEGPTSSATSSRVTSAVVTLPANTINTVWCYLKRGNTDWIRFFVSYAAFGSANGAGAWFNLATGQKGAATAFGDADQVSSEITDAGNGWYRCSLTSRSPSTANVLVTTNTASADGSATRVNSGTYYPWGADLRLATDAAYPYQRVAAATDYADVGVPRSFLFDGFDDSLYTASNMDLSGTDKVTVLAGVRKFVDVFAIVAETSADSTSNNGAFILCPGSVNFASFGSRGNATYRQANSASGSWGSPGTVVSTGIANISAPQSSVRVNGVQSDNLLSQGTGNFGSYVLFIGRRNNASLPFNGKAYQLIVRGALTEGNALRSGEVFVGQKTGVAL